MYYLFEIKNLLSNPRRALEVRCSPTTRCPNTIICHTTIVKRVELVVPVSHTSWSTIVFHSSLLTRLCGRRRQVASTSSKTEVGVSSKQPSASGPLASVSPHASIGTAKHTACVAARFLQMRGSLPAVPSVPLECGMERKVCILECPDAQIDVRCSTGKNKQLFPCFQNAQRGKIGKVTAL